MLVHGRQLGQQRHGIRLLGQRMHVRMVQRMVQHMHVRMVKRMGWHMG